MQDSSVFGRALNPVEMQQHRYLDALHSFRSVSGLRMEEGGEEKGSEGGDAGAADKGGKGDEGGKGGGAEKGYPPNTPISEMTAEQRAAYFEEKARTEENRRKDMTRLTGGKYGDDLKADMEELARLRSARMTDSEKAVEEARTATRAEVALENVRSAFDLLLPDDMSDEDKEAKLEVLNLKAFLTDDGKVDTAKVKTHAATLTPAKGSTTDRDYGQGRRGAGPQKSGVSAGADMFAARKKPISS